MSKHLADLKKLCKSAPSSRDKELVEIGDTMWLMGRPVSSDDGMIAIAQTEDLHLIVRERDIIEVDRTEEVDGTKTSFSSRYDLRRQRHRPVSESCKSGAAGLQL